MVLIVTSGKRLLCTTLQTVVQNSYGEARMNGDQVKGRIDEAKGKARVVAGQVIGNKRLEQKGTIQNYRGTRRAAYGDLKKNIKKIIGSR